MGITRLSVGRGMLTLYTRKQEPWHGGDGIDPGGGNRRLRVPGRVPRTLPRVGPTRGARGALRARAFQSSTRSRWARVIVHISTSVPAGLHAPGVFLRRRQARSPVASLEQTTVVSASRGWKRVVSELSQR